MVRSDKTTVYLQDRLYRGEGQRKGWGKTQNNQQKNTGKHKTIK